MKSKFSVWGAAVVAVVIAANDCSAAHPINLDQAAAMSGSVHADFQISSDSRWVVYRTDQIADDSGQLYCVAATGGSPLKLNGSLVPGGRVNSWKISPDGNEVVYWSDQVQVDVSEVFAVGTAGGSPLKLNSPLVDHGSSGGAIVGNRVLYVASDHTNAFFEPYYEVFSVPMTGGPAQRLNGPLVAGGDVRGILTRADVGRVLYLADQDADEVVDLYSVSAVGTGEPVSWPIGDHLAA